MSKTKVRRALDLKYHFFYLFKMNIKEIFYPPSCKRSYLEKKTLTFFNPPKKTCNDISVSKVNFPFWVNYPFKRALSTLFLMTLLRFELWVALPVGKLPVK